MKKFNPNVTLLCLCDSWAKLFFLFLIHFFFPTVWNVCAFKPMPLLFANDANTASCCYISLNCHVHSYHCFCLFHFHLAAKQSCHCFRYVCHWIGNNVAGETIRSIFSDFSHIIVAAHCFCPPPKRIERVTIKSCNECWNQFRLSGVICDEVFEHQLNQHVTATIIISWVIFLPITDQTRVAVNAIFCMQLFHQSKHKRLNARTHNKFSGIFFNDRRIRNKY